MNAVLYFRSSNVSSASAKFAGVRDIAERTNWRLCIIEEVPTVRLLTALIKTWQPIGCIVEGGAQTESGLDPAIAELLPTVFFDHNPALLPQGSFSVSHDSQATGAMAARELILSGYEHFAFIHPAQIFSWSLAREQGFAKVLKANGKTCSVFAPKGGSSSAVPAADYHRQLRNFLETLPKPCAIFAATDRTASEVLNALDALRIPRHDYSIIGVDNYAEICEHTSPKLTSIEPDFRGGGSTAVLMLMALLRFQGKFVGNRHRVFGPKRIVRRESTTLPPGFDAEISAALELIDAESCLGLTAARVVAGFKGSRDMAEIRFRKATGMSILEAIHHRRLQRAKELLANPFIQLKSISDFCGYKSPLSMQQFFRKATGMSMSQWRSITGESPAAADAKSAKGHKAGRVPRRD